MKTTDLTPKFKSLRPAYKELEREYVAGERPFGESVGGLQAYSQVFKRGYGDKVFGSSEDGIWLGAADFADAPFSVNMDGQAVFKDDNGSTVIDSTGLVSTTSFDTSLVAVSSPQTVTSSSYVDVTNSTMTFTLARDALVLMLASTDMFLVESTGNTGRGFVTLFVDGSAKYGMTIHSGINEWATYSTHNLQLLTAGEHTIKLRSKVDIIAGSPSLEVEQSILTRIILGT